MDLGLGMAFWLSGNGEETEQRMEVRQVGRVGC
jgi:hypothetical protein